MNENSPATKQGTVSLDPPTKIAGEKMKLARLFRSSLSARAERAHLRASLPQGSEPVRAHFPSEPAARQKKVETPKNAASSRQKRCRKAT
jgi:hypothetical protein